MYERKLSTTPITGMVYGSWFCHGLCFGAKQSRLNVQQRRNAEKTVAGIRSLLNENQIFDNEEAWTAFLSQCFQTVRDGHVPNQALISDNNEIVEQVKESLWATSVFGTDAQLAPGRIVQFGQMLASDSLILYHPVQVS